MYVHNMRHAASRLLGEIYENNLNGLHLKLIKYKYEYEQMSIHMGIKIKTAKEIIVKKLWKKNNFFNDKVHGLLLPVHIGSCYSKLNW